MQLLNPKEGVCSMRMCEFKQKEVINCRDGERLGYICDLEFDIQTGVITQIIVPGPCKIWGILGRDQEYVISYNCIKQIGTDVILVDIDAEKALVKCLFV
jgi:YlmC/YmxH family sporulation protein